ncbi:MAG: serine protease, partial [Holosporales bacterium]|nr:serine protease [Holosporales bacterium]
MQAAFARWIVVVIFLLWQLCIIGAASNSETVKKPQSRTAAQLREKAERYNPEELVSRNAKKVALITIFKNGAEDGANLVYNAALAPANAQVSVTSGVIVSDGGLIVTNADNIDEGDRIFVTIESERKTPSNDHRFEVGSNDYAATIVAIIPEVNVAVLKIQPRNNEKFEAVKFGNDAALMEGKDISGGG